MIHDWNSHSVEDERADANAFDYRKDSFTRVTMDGSGCGRCFELLLPLGGGFRQGQTKEKFFASRAHGRGSSAFSRASADSMSAHVGARQRQRVVLFPQMRSLPSGENDTPPDPVP